MHTLMYVYGWINNGNSETDVLQAMLNFHSVSSISAPLWMSINILFWSVTQSLIYQLYYQCLL